MTILSLLDEVEHLNAVSTRLEHLAAHHPSVTTELLTIAGNIRSAGTLLAVLAATRPLGRDGDHSD